MNKQDINIAKEFKSKNYERIIDYVDQVQQKLISLWQTVDSNTLEHMILITRNNSNFWIESVCQDRLCATLIRCGALVGTLETIEKLIYEKNMNLWLQNGISNEAALKYKFTKIIKILNLNGVMTHNELITNIQESDDSDIVTIINTMVDLQLIKVTKLGKSNSYSLTDAGIRYARYLKTSNQDNVYN